MEYKKISKRLAKKLFEQGRTVYLQSSKMSVDNPWQPASPINAEGEEKNFDKIINAFHYYNCDEERGMTIHFYIKRV